MTHRIFCFILDPELQQPFGPSSQVYHGKEWSQHPVKDKWNHDHKGEWHYVAIIPKDLHDSIPSLLPKVSRCSPESLKVPEAQFQAINLNFNWEWDEFYQLSELPNAIEITTKDPMARDRVTKDDMIVSVFGDIDLLAIQSSGPCLTILTLTQAWKGCR